MAPEQLQKTKDILQWERTSYAERLKDSLDETAVCALLRASLLRNSRDWEASRTMLKTELLAHKK